MEKNGANTKQLSVLIVDDEPEILDILAPIVEGIGFQAITATNGALALGQIAQHHQKLALVVSDFKMPGMTGLELRARMMEQYKHIPFLVFSGNITREEALQAVELKISGFAEKPLELETIGQLMLKHSADRAQELREEAELLQAFIADVDNLTEEMEALLLSLQASPGDVEAINRIFAIAHTIKGSSGFFSSKTLHKFTHAYEDYLSPYKRTATPVPAEALSVLLQGLDTIKSLLGSLQEGLPDPDPLEKLLAIFRPVDAKAQAGPGLGVAAAPVGGGPRDDIKVPIKVLDRFTELSGEITVIRNMINKLVRSIEKEVPGNRDVSLLSELLDEMHKINSQMQEKVVDLRKISCRSIFRPLHRAVRDLSSSLNKEVNFQVRGEELRVDTAIAEALSNSLIHMVRNSMDHGLENGGIRQAQGKSAAGTITIEAKEANQEVVVTISDDGKGIDPELIRRKAVEKGLFSAADAARLSKKDLQALIFESGFSTAGAVTDVSGRGVGMDMVKKTISGAGGRIEIESEPGRGTSFRLCIPIPKSVTIISSLLVRAGEQLFAIPQESLCRLIAFPAENRDTFLRSTEGTDLLLLDQELLPVLNLAAALSGARDCFRAPCGNADLSCAIVKCEAGEFAIFVDEIHDAEDTVVKKLGSHLSSISIFQGATFLGDGRVGLILDIPECAAKTGIFRSGNGTRTANASQASPPVARESAEGRSLLLFELGQPGTYGIFLEDVFRLENLPRSGLQHSGGQRVTVYRGKTCPVLPVGELLGYKAPEENGTADDLPALMLALGQHHVALTVRKIVDLVHSSAPLDSGLADRKGVSGALIHNEKAITVLNASELRELVLEMGIGGAEELAPAPVPAEDSAPSLRIAA